MDTEELGLEKDFTDIMEIAVNLISKNNEYFVTPSLYEIKINNKMGIIESTKFVIRQNLPVSILCLKLIHNLSMLEAFHMNYILDNNINIIKNEFRGNEEFYLKLSVSSNNINIEKRKGFGLFAYNVDDMALTLGEILPALRKHLIKIVEQNKDLSDLQRVIDFIKNIKMGLEPNAAIYLFIKENIDLYKGVK